MLFINGPRAFDQKKSEFLDMKGPEFPATLP